MSRGGTLNKTITQNSQYNIMQYYITITYQQFEVLFKSLNSILFWASTRQNYIFEHWILLDEKLIFTLLMGELLLGLISRNEKPQMIVLIVDNYHCSWMSLKEMLPPPSNPALFSFRCSSNVQKVQTC